MRRAHNAACSPVDNRCYDFADSSQDAKVSCTPKGRFKIGWICANGGRDYWDIWLDLNTGERRFRRRFKFTHEGKQYILQDHVNKLVGTARQDGKTAAEGEAKRLPNEAAAKAKDEFETLATDRQAGKMRKVLNTSLLREQD